VAKHVLVCLLRLENIHEIVKSIFRFAYEQEIGRVGGVDGGAFGYLCSATSTSHIGTRLRLRA
jgi:hypothetical protein